MANWMESAAVRGSTWLPAGWARRALLANRATIFVLGRFAVPDLGVRGHDPEQVRTALAFLRRQGCPLLSIRDLLRRVSTGEPIPAGAIAFTIDDGYMEQATVAGPLFAEFDCPVTTFVCTDFLDQYSWLWWDRIEYVFEHTHHRTLPPALTGRAKPVFWANPCERLLFQYELCVLCTTLSTREREHVIRALSAELEVEIPFDAPARYAAMTWEQLRTAERTGMEFGPRSATHPTLSQLRPTESEREIEGSWTRLCKTSSNPCPVFSFPGGREEDFGDTELRIVESLDFAGALTARTGHVDLAALRTQPAGRFALPRVGLPTTREELVRWTNGIARLLPR